MPWIKQGRIFNLETEPWRRTTHAQVPTPHVMKDRIRIYYACRTTRGKSFPSYFDLDFDLKTILYTHEKPIMTMGKPGMFDADGCMPSCVIENSGELWMYYIGWSELKNTARYQNEIGLAVSKDGGETFERMSPGPIMGRSLTEPGLAVMPFVNKPDNKFCMWYQSGTGWNKVGDKYEPTYVIKYAESLDGIHWDRAPQSCVPISYPMEAFSRPSIIQTEDKWEIWYCYRDSKDYRGGKGSYRIGYADSTNGMSFVRKDYEAGVSVGGIGEWDYDMVAYPYVFELDGKRVMLYNGNGFGQTGIGLATWQD